MNQKRGALRFICLPKSLAAFNFRRFLAIIHWGIDSYDELIYTINDALQKAGSKPKTIEDRDTLLDTLPLLFEHWDFRILSFFHH